MTRMSHTISVSTASTSKITRYLDGSALTPSEQWSLDLMRKRAHGQQEELDEQGLDWGLSLPEALAHLTEGRADAPGACAGNAYRAALQIVIYHTGTDTTTHGTYAKPSTYFGLMDEELQRLGVSDELLVHRFLYAGPPEDLPVVLPPSLDGYPEIGHLAIARAKEVAESYQAVRARVHADFRHELDRLTDLFLVEHEQWGAAVADPESQDTIFFSLV
jgi:hypothetical protein